MGTLYQGSVPISGGGNTDEILSNAKAYTDERIAAIPTPDVSGQIDTHNSDSSAHADIRSSVDSALSGLDGKAPTSHASSSATYGIGTGSNYGHVKLSDSTSSTSAASAGIAASPAAVKAAYDLANSKLSSVFYAGTSAPSNTSLLWIDTTANTGGLKYYNGSAWTHVPVAYT